MLPSITILELVKMEPKMLLLELLEVLNGFGFAACPSYEMSTLHTVSTVTLFNSTSTERLFKRRFWFYYHLPLRPARWHLPLPYFQGTSTTQICCSSDASCLIAGCTVHYAKVNDPMIFNLYKEFHLCILYHTIKANLIPKLQNTKLTQLTTPTMFSEQCN